MSDYLSDEEWNKKSLTDRTLVMHSSRKHMLGIIESDERIKNRMNAITVATVLLETIPPSVWMFAARFTELGWNMTHQKEVFLFSGEDKDTYSFMAYAPTFIWKYCTKDSIEHFILECEEDFTLKYPIKYVQVVSEKNKLVATEHLLYTPEECIEYLDKILRKL